MHWGWRSSCGGVDLLARLVDRSLVVAISSTHGIRYRMLESVTAYCLERLHEAGEFQNTRHRHARYYLDLADRDHRRLRTSRPLAPGWAAPGRRARTVDWRLLQVVRTRPDRPTDRRLRDRSGVPRAGQAVGHRARLQARGAVR